MDRNEILFQRSKLLCVKISDIKVHICFDDDGDIRCLRKGTKFVAKIKDAQSIRLPNPVILSPRVQCVNESFPFLFVRLVACSMLWS